MNPSFSRRHFLRSASLGLGAAACVPLVLSSWARAQTPETLIEDPSDADALKAVAHRALEAARAAGAHYADLRILTGLRMKWEGPPNATASVDEAGRSHGIGMPILLGAARIWIRAFMNGHIGFAGNILSHDADQIAALARLAVSRAKTWQAAGSPASKLAPAPVVAEGYWETPSSAIPSPTRAYRLICFATLSMPDMLTDGLVAPSASVHSTTLLWPEISMSAPLSRVARAWFSTPATSSSPDSSSPSMASSTR